MFSRYIDKFDYSSRFRILKGGKISLVVSAILGSAIIASAAPTGEQVVSGNVNIDRNTQNVTNINQTTNKSIINWQNFNVAGNETVNFNMPSSNSSSLNRVIGNNKSEIYGQINSNGQVFLINQNGVYFGKDSQVNTAGLVASTRDITDENFNNSNYIFEGNSDASIINLGTITTDNAYTVLLAKKVENEGVIKAHLGSVQLASGEGFTLDINGNSLVKLTIDKGTLDGMIANKGAIIADGGEIYLTTSALDTVLNGLVNNTGIIQANSVEEKDGKIILFAHGGTANISGSITAEGGFVETSGEKVKINDDFRVKADKWLIDPNDFTISASGGDMSGATLSTNLSGTSVEIQTATMGTSGGNGDIFVNDEVTWSSGNTLTLNAERNIEINSVIDASGGDGGKLVLQYGQGAEATGNTAFYDVNAPVKLQSGQNFSTKLGSDGSTIDWTVITSLGAEGSTTGTDLQGINGALAGNYVLGADIDATSTSAWNTAAGFDPIGDNVTKFTGKFDGLGNTISNLTINRPSEDNVGLFGYGNYVTIKNIGLINVNVIGLDQVGGLIGQIDQTWPNESKVSDAYVTGTVQGERKVGGLIGYLNDYGATITDVYATANVRGTGSESTGGLIGDNRGIVNNAYATGIVTGGWATGGLIGDNHGTVTNVYATGEVIGNLNITVNSAAGGLIGSHRGTIDTAYATGKVTGINYVGGLVGENDWGNFDWGELNEITNSYATGVVEGTGDRIGGLVGYHAKGTVTDSYATGNVNGDRIVGGLIGGNSSTVTNSYAIGDVAGTRYNIGGLVGFNSGTVTASYATGNVNGSFRVGGLIGENQSSVTNSYAKGIVAATGSQAGGLIGFNSWASTTNSYSTGAVSGTDRVGGLVGRNDGSTITNSYSTGLVNNGVASADVGGFVGNGNVGNTNFWDTETSGQTTSAGNAVGKTTAQMLDNETYFGWDTDVWSFSKVGLGAAVAGYEYGGVAGLPYLTNVTRVEDRNGAEAPIILFNSGWGDVDGNGVYTITNATQLQNIHLVANQGFDFELSNAIDLAGVTWNPIGSFLGDLSESFNGSFNGLNQTISNLTVGGVNQTHVGLFGSINNASLTNVHLDGVHASGISYIGGLVGSGFGTNTIKNILITNTARDSIIENSGTSYNINTIGSVGGDVSSVEMENIVSHAHVEIYSVDQQVDKIGGLFGHLAIHNSATAGPNNLVNHGDVTVWSEGLDAFSNIGGLIGDFSGQSHLTLDTIEMTGDVIVGSSGRSARNTGGLIGSISGINIIDNAIMRGDFKTHITIDGTQHKAFGLQESGGLFGYLNSNTEIKNSYMYGDVDVQLSSSPIYDWWNTYGIGGILGTASSHLGIVLNNVHTHGDVTVVMGAGEPVEMDGFAVGGLLGINWNEVTITDSSMRGNISGLNNVGGLVGELSAKLTVTNSHFLGETISGHDYVGGLVGNIHDFYGPSGDQLIITGSSSLGAISGNNYVGGLIGKLPTHNDWATHQISQSHSTATVTATGDYAGGLVGYMDKTAIDNSYFAGSVSGANNVGGLVGYMYNSSVTESYATGAVEGAESVGGLIGYAIRQDSPPSTIRDTYATGSVNGTNEVGGLVGRLEGEAIVNSYATGAVTATATTASNGNTVGGLVGYNYFGTITNAYATGAVTAANYTDWNGYAVGGLVGYNYGLGAITNAYATGAVSGNWYVGGLVGDNDDYATITNAYATGAVSGNNYGGGLVGLNSDDTGENVINSFWDTTKNVGLTSAGGEGKITADLKKIATFSGTTPPWSIVGDSTQTPNYPTLRMSDSGAVWTIGTKVVSSDSSPTPKQTIVDNVVNSVINNIANVPTLPTNINIGQSISSIVTNTSGNISMSNTVKTLIPNIGDSTSNFTLVSKTDGVQTIGRVTMEELLAKANESNGNAGGISEIRVALAPDSFVELVNGGLKLPDGVSQEFYVVEEK